MFHVEPMPLYHGGKGRGIWVESCYDQLCGDAGNLVEKALKVT